MGSFRKWHARVIRSRAILCNVRQPYCVYLPYILWRLPSSAADRFALLTSFGNLFEVLDRRR